MRTTLLLALGAAMIGLPVLAQTTAPGSSPGSAGMAPSATISPSSGAGSDSRSPGPPIDRGPSTPEANQAHRGGGAVLEGAPGAPAPAPQPTPPRDAPHGR